VEAAALVTIDRAASDCLHDHSPSFEGLFASQELLNQKWELQRFCNTVPNIFLDQFFVQSA